MITSVAEGLKRYKQELRTHNRWYDRLKARYGDALTVDPIGLLDSAAWREVHEQNATLRAMVKVLGLTKREETAIDRTIGIEAPRRRRTKKPQ